MDKDAKDWVRKIEKLLEKYLSLKINSLNN